MAPPKAATARTPASAPPRRAPQTLNPPPALSLRDAPAILTSLALLLLASLSSPTSLLSLSPVYGSIPPQTHHARLLQGAVLAGWALKTSSVPAPIQRFLSTSAASTIPLFAFLIPTIQNSIAPYSGFLGATYGPLLTELLTLFPLIALSVYAVAGKLEKLRLSERYGERWEDLVPGIWSYVVFSTAEKACSTLLPPLMGSSLLLTRSGLQYAIAACYALLLSSRLLLVFALPILYAASANPHLQLQRNTMALNATLAKMNYVVLDRKESLTGYVSVLENVVRGFRVMRCDHSLLGGEWTPREEGGVREPIYSCFEMLEAVRLVEVEETGRRGDAEAQALVIGLGIGTTPTALLAHGINTTIVEIDPVVHEFATKHFCLPTNHTAIIEDAVAFVREREHWLDITAGTGDDAGWLGGGPLPSDKYRYDYIIHDVFTGGAEPAELFTREFLQGLKALTRRDGVVAINYAGDILLPTFPLIVRTIHSVFPACRIFREDAPATPKPNSPPTQDFTNTIFFCLKSPPSTSSGDQPPFTFRKPVKADFLGSQSRESSLVPEFEIDAAQYLEVKEGEQKVLKRGETQALEALQMGSAKGHWGIMRGVLDLGVWVYW